MNNKNINQIVNQVVDIQLDAIEKLKETFDDNFDDIIKFLSKINGRIVVSGIGKSAIIGMKISSTLNSTGTPSIFIHGSDALHGDLGAITKDDVLIYISKSGSNSDTVDLVNSLKKNGVDIVSITANKDSYLAKNSRHIIYTPIHVEACPNNLAPTTSTGIQLLVGDIIAICLMSLKNFDKISFAKLHPSGSLGKKLTTTVEDLIDTQHAPFIDLQSKFSDACLLYTSDAADED